MATDTAAATSPWLTVEEAAARAQLGRKTIYALIKQKKMRAAIVGGRRAIRLKAEWIDEALTAHAAPVELGGQK